MKYNRLILPMLVLGCAFTAEAVRALDSYVKMMQPDGSVINVKKCGDEFSHYSLSTDGALLVEVGDAYYFGSIDENGIISSSNILAVDPIARSAAEQEAVTIMTPSLAEKIQETWMQRPRRVAEQSGMGRLSNSFPTKGDVKSLVILVSYMDVDFNLEDPHGYFDGLLNTDGFNEYGATGCVAEYFRFNSNNQFRPKFTVVGPVILPQKRSYYGANGINGSDQAAHKMVVHAIEQLDESVDFSEFDMDHDGVVDNVYLIYAGEGEASGGPASSVWPHSWTLQQAGETLMADGVAINSYGCSNEWFGDRPDGMGTFTHEFSHVIGLPDLYSTTYGNSSYATPGPWSVLDYGPYLNNGRTPPNYSSYERLALEWIDPIVIERREDYILDNLAETNQACLIQTSNKNEYYLLENRQKTGWDTYLPNSGMLIWHIDYVKPMFTGNKVNNDRNHMFVDLKKANNIIDAINDEIYEGWCWPGTAGKTEFSDNTEPSMKTWSGEMLELPLTDIKLANGLISFKAAGGKERVLPPEVLAPINWGEDWFEALWNPSENAVDYYLTVIESVKKGDREILINDMGSGSTFTLPEGWTSSATKVYTTAGNYGEASPAYKMSIDNAYISTPKFDRDVEKISFWYKGINCDGILEVAGVDHEDNNVAIANITPEDQKGHSVIIDDIPEGVVKVIFTFKKSTGNIALDDIEIAISEYATSILDGYNRNSTNGETSVRIKHSGDKNTEFTYYVEATDGHFISRRSATMKVPHAQNEVADILADELSFDLDGRTLHFDIESEVYDLAGRLLYRGKSTYTVGAAGIYIVRQNGQTAKVSVK